MPSRHQRKASRKQTTPPTSSHSKQQDQTSDVESNFNLDRFLQKTILFLFCLLVITVPMTFSWINEELFEFPKILATYAFTTVIIGLWVIRMIINKRLILKKSWFDIPIILFIITQIISTIISIDVRTSLLGYYTRFHGGLLSTLSYSALYFAFVSNIRKKQVSAVILALGIGAAASSLYAIPEHFGFSPSCVLIAGQGGVDCWVQDVQTRIFGTFGQPNWLAAYGITLIPLFVSVFLSGARRPQAPLSALVKQERARYFLYGTALLLTVTTLYTKSRSGALGLAVGGLLFGGLLLARYFSVSSSDSSSQKTKPNTEVRLLLRSISVGAVFGIIGLLLGTPFTPSLTQLPSFVQTKLSVNQVQDSSQEMNVSTTPASNQPQLPVNRLETGGTESGEIRKIVWTGALDVWKRYPWFGSGVETFAYSYYQDRPMAHNTVSEWDFLYNKAHNEFLNFLATTGIIGTASYVLLLAWLFLGFLRVALSVKQERKTQLLAIGLASGIVALSVSNFFGFSTVMVAVLLYLYPALFAVHIRADEVKPQPTTENLNMFQSAGILLIASICIFLLTKVSNYWQADVAYATGKQLAQAGRISDGAAYLQRAIRLLPGEAVYYEELGIVYANMAVYFDQQGLDQDAATLIEAAELASDTTYQLNPVHINFYKSRARVFITLAQIDLEYLRDAQHILEEAQEKAPTDAKITYNLGLVHVSLEELDQGIQYLEETVAQKPNYPQALMNLADAYSAQGSYQQAYEYYTVILEEIDPANTIAEKKREQLIATQSGVIKQ